MYMYKKLLDQFFQKNTLQSELPTAPALAHFYISLEKNPQDNEEIREIMNEVVFEDQPGRKEEALAEQHEIESVTTSDQLLRFMRRHTDPVNQHILVNKAMEFEDEIVSQIIRMLKTSLNEGFIETAIRILAKSEQDVAGKLIKYYDDIRLPYAQSMVLVLLGFKADEAEIPWLIEQYEKLKRLYPDESHCEGAYYALCEIGGRFYPTGKRQKK